MFTVTNRLDSRHRADQAARLAATGATWQEIADTLGYRSRQAASQAVKRLHDRTPPESIGQARAKHDNALRLLQRSGFTRYLLAVGAGDDDTAIRYAKELRSTIAERAKLAGAYAPEQIDVIVNTDPGALLDQLETALLERDEQRQRQLSPPVINAEVEEIEG